LSTVHAANRHISRSVRVFKESAAQMARTLFHPSGLARVLINGPLANERRRSAQGQNRSIFRRGVDDALGSNGPSWLGYAIDRCGNLSAVSSPIFMPEVEGRAGLSPLRAGFRARQGSNACRTPSEQRVLRPLCKTQVP
jgi:hypothetical protein